MNHMYKIGDHIRITNPEACSLPAEFQDCEGVIQMLVDFPKSLYSYSGTFRVISKVRDHKGAVYYYRDKGVELMGGPW